MGSFLLKIVLFSILCWGVLWCMSSIIERGLSKSYDYEMWLFHITKETHDAEMIFIGSSRAKVQYNPKIFDSVLNINTYNLGVSGWPIEMHKAAYDIYSRKNRNPKYIIFNVDEHLLYEKKGVAFYADFVPFINDSSIIKVLKKYPETLKWQEYYIPMYKYTNLRHLISEGLKSYFNLDSRQKKNKIYKGYFPQHLSWNQTSLDRLLKINPNGEYTPIDESAKNIFENWIIDCKKQNITVIFCRLPIYYELSDIERNRYNYENYYKKIATKHNIPYLNYNTDSTRYKKEYYIDPTHFNSRTADYYSRKIALEIKNRRLLE